MFNANLKDAIETEHNLDFNSKVDKNQIAHTTYQDDKIYVICTLQTNSWKWNEKNKKHTVAKA